MALEQRPLHRQQPGLVGNARGRLSVLRVLQRSGHSAVVAVAGEDVQSRLALGGMRPDGAAGADESDASVLVASRGGKKERRGRARAWHGQPRWVVTHGLDDGLHSGGLALCCCLVQGGSDYRVQRRVHACSEQALHGGHEPVPRGNVERGVHLALPPRVHVRPKLDEGVHAVHGAGSAPKNSHDERGGAVLVCRVGRVLTVLQHDPEAPAVALVRSEMQGGAPVSVAHAENGSFGAAFACSLEGLQRHLQGTLITICAGITSK